MMSRFRKYATASAVFLVLTLLLTGLPAAAESESDTPSHDTSIVIASEPEISKRDESQTPVDTSEPDTSSAEESAEESDDRPVTVKIIQADGGYVAVSDRYAAIGDTVTVNALPVEGFELAAILRDGVLCGASFVMDSDETTITAVFNKLPDTSEEVSVPEGAHSITVVQPEHGKVSVSVTYAVNGERVNVTTTPDSGYELNQIVVNGAGLSRKYFNMPDIDVTVTATFKKVSTVSSAPVYDITVNSEGKGSVSVNRDTATSGAEITVTVVADDGWHLSAIFFNGNGQSTDSQRYTFDMPSKDVDIEVVFSPDEGVSDENGESEDVSVSDESSGTNSENDVSDEQSPDTSAVYVSFTSAGTPGNDGDSTVFYYVIPFFVIGGICAMLLIKRRI